MALLVDEWGIWADVQPGTNNHFMFQQNSLRDALVAASTMNIFNNHADRVRGANLAQTVNVIHSLILTKGDVMVKTPTYYVFDLYKAHQGARLLPVNFQSPDYQSAAGHLAAINASASIDSNRMMHITLVNLDPVHTLPATASLAGFHAEKATGQILTAPAFTDINDFGIPEKVRIKPLAQHVLNGNQLTVQMPPKSIVCVEIRCGK